MKSNDYDLIHGIYDKLSKVIFANRIYLAQIEHLYKVKNKSSILFIGGGTGKILNKIIRINPYARIVYVEKSIQMLNSAKKECNHNKQVQFIHGDENSIPEIQFDVIISFFFLDLFLEKKQQIVFKKLSSTLKRGGIWLVADFLPANNLWQTILEKVMFQFLKTTTKIQSSEITEINSLFRNEFFVQEAYSLFFKSYIFSSLYRKR